MHKQGPLCRSGPVVVPRPRGKLGERRLRTQVGLLIGILKVVIINVLIQRIEGILRVLMEFSAPQGMCTISFGVSMQILTRICQHTCCLSPVPDILGYTCSETTRAGLRFPQNL